MRERVSSIRWLAFVAAMYLGAEVSGVPMMAAAPVPICEEVCTESADCTEVCYENMMEFGNGNDQTCLEYGIWDTDSICCGDGVCNMDSGDNENNNCPADCGPIDPDCPTGPTCNPYNQTGCDSDEACANNGCCVSQEGITPPDPEPACFEVFCFKDSDCCPDEVCIKRTGWPISPSGVCYIRLT